MPEFLAALIALVLAVIVGVFLKKPAQNLVVYLRNLTQRQQYILVAIAFAAVVIEIFIFRKP